MTEVIYVFLGKSAYFSSHSKVKNHRRKSSSLTFLPSTSSGEPESHVGQSDRQKTEQGAHTWVVAEALPPISFCRLLPMAVVLDLVPFCSLHPSSSQDKL